MAFVKLPSYQAGLLGQLEQVTLVDVTQVDLDLTGSRTPAQFFTLLGAGKRKSFDVNPDDYDALGTYVADPSVNLEVRCGSVNTNVKQAANTSLGTFTRKASGSAAWTPWRMQVGFDADVVNGLVRMSGSSDPDGGLVSADAPTAAQLGPLLNALYEGFINARDD